MQKVLIVDDEEAIRRSLALLLRLNQFQTEAASSIEGALSAFERNPPDIVICDMVLDGGRGTVAIEAMRAIDPKVRIIAMSGGPTNADGDLLSRASEAGADATIEKPFEASELLSLIRSNTPA